jgi:hypothetical protein
VLQPLTNLAEVLVSAIPHWIDSDVGNGQMGAKVKGWQKKWQVRSWIRSLGASGCGTMPLGFGTIAVKL